MVVLVPLLVGACGGDDGGGEESGGGTSAPTSGTTAPGEGSGTTATTAAAAVDRPDALTGTWEGSYSCASGTSRLRLTILDVNEGDVRAFFESTEVGGGAPTGSFRMTGTNTDGTLTLEGLDWVEQAQGGEMVGLQADTGSRADTELLEGTVVGGGCETFTVGRTASEPWYVGHWEGGYICAQGRTGMTLDIESTGGNTVDAVVGFFPLDDNPNVPSGSYSMEGNWTGGRLALRGVEWVEQPPGYVMVDIYSNPDVAIGPDRLAGGIEDPSCEAFILERAAA